MIFMSVLSIETIILILFLRCRIKTTANSTSEFVKVPALLFLIKFRFRQIRTRFNNYIMQKYNYSHAAK